MTTQTPEYITAEKPAIELFQALGYEYFDASTFDPRESISDVVLEDNFLSAIKKLNDLTLIDKSTTLNLSQKEELKLAHGEIFKNKQHIALTLDKKFAPEIADYDASSYQIGKITYYCSNATSMINYIPLNFFICEEIITDKTKTVDERLLEYVKKMIKLNKD